MYQTSYSDMTQGRELSVRSDFPSGYQDHVPSVGHDITFRNTAFDRKQGQKKFHPARKIPNAFEEQIAGAWGARSHEFAHFRTPRGSRSNEAAMSAGTLAASEARPSAGDVQGTGGFGHKGMGVPEHVPHDHEKGKVYTRSDRGFDHHADPVGETHPESATRPTYYAGASDSNEAARIAGTILASESTWDAHAQRTRLHLAPGAHMTGAHLARGPLGNVYISLRSGHGFDRHPDPVGLSPVTSTFTPQLHHLARGGLVDLPPPGRESYGEVFR